jgi:hypothetical protein
VNKKSKGEIDHPQEPKESRSDEKGCSKSFKHYDKLNSVEELPDLKFLWTPTTTQKHAIIGK